MRLLKLFVLALQGKLRVRKGIIYRREGDGIIQWNQILGIRRPR